MSPDWDEIASMKRTKTDDCVAELSAAVVQLRAERDAARATLKEICAEWNEGCDPACDSAGHSTTCKATSIAVAKRALQADLDAARALFERGCYNLMLMMQAYERRVRSDCTTPEQISARPWECAEYVEASRYLRKVWPIDAALKEPPNVR